MVWAIDMLGDRQALFEERASLVECAAKRQRVAEVHGAGGQERMIWRKRGIAQRKCFGVVAQRIVGLMANLLQDR